jgi:hypothetical protein
VRHVDANGVPDTVLLVQVPRRESGAGAAAGTAQQAAAAAAGQAAASAKASRVRHRKAVLASGALTNTVQTALKALQVGWFAAVPCSLRRHHQRPVTGVCASTLPTMLVVGFSHCLVMHNLTDLTVCPLPHVFTQSNAVQESSERDVLHGLTTRIEQLLESSRRADWAPAEPLPSSQSPWVNALLSYLQVCRAAGCRHCLHTLHEQRVCRRCLGRCSGSQTQGSNQADSLEP